MERMSWPLMGSMVNLVEMSADNIEVHTDGGARGNPGPAASAYVVEVNGSLLNKGAKYLGIATNNVAEYQGVILALNWLYENISKLEGKDIIFFLDSELVVKQMLGVYRVKDENLKKLFFEIFFLIKKFPQKIAFKHVERNRNKLADLLVNEELDKNRKNSGNVQ